LHLPERVLRRAEDGREIVQRRNGISFLKIPP
jgi:hypothetical protein